MPFDYNFSPGASDCEDLERYEPGGYHPVRLYDDLLNDRYLLVHKLGHGGFGTVWLARDFQDDRHVALKIVQAETSKCCNELKVYQDLKKASQEDVPFVTQLLDHFRLQGVNGEHVCLVMPVLGPGLNVFAEHDRSVKIRPDTVRKFAKQSLKAVAGLHHRGICLGDISTSNLLLKLATSTLESTERIYARFGQPRGYEVHEANANHEHHLVNAPWQQYGPIDFLSSELTCLDQEICVVDFGEAVLSITTGQPTDEASPSPGINGPYAAPELLFTSEKSFESDVWSLACCWFELRSGKQLFSRDFMDPTTLSIVRRIWYACGPLPSAFNDKMAEEYEGWDLPEHTCMDEYEGDMSLPGRVDGIGKFDRWFNLNDNEKLEAMRELHPKIHRDTVFDEEHAKQEIRDCLPPPPKALSTEERDDFLDLLTRMLKYDRRERITIEEIANHPWLTKDYAEDLDLSESVYQKYTDGHEYLEDPSIGCALPDVEDCPEEEASEKAKVEAEGQDEMQVELRLKD